MSVVNLGQARAKKLLESGDILPDLFIPAIARMIGLSADDLANDLGISEPQARAFLYDEQTTAPAPPLYERVNAYMLEKHLLKVLGYLRGVALVAGYNLTPTPPT